MGLDYGYLVAQALVYALENGEGILVRDENKRLFAVFRIDNGNISGIHVASAEDLDIDLSQAECGHRIIMHDTEEEAEQARIVDRMKLN